MLPETCRQLKPNKFTSFYMIFIETYKKKQFILKFLEIKYKLNIFILK